MIPKPCVLTGSWTIRSAGLSVETGPQSQRSWIYFYIQLLSSSQSQAEACENVGDQTG